VTCLFGRWQVSFVVFFNFVIDFEFINLKFYFHHFIGIEDTPGDTENGETEDDIVSTVTLNNR